LMVEGGGTIHTQLMAANLADEVHLAIAPLLVGVAPPLTYVAFWPRAGCGRSRGSPRPGEGRSGQPSR
ncbi:dihydrofolate reductase family protein, partial [Streptomyces avermitilis]|uniref:dihydrofolate reductase family protein n=1 Tax=Streptomyces avermitilis TaxID=33903 RepID=UPI0033BD4D40